MTTNATTQEQATQEARAAADTANRMYRGWITINRGSKAARIASKQNRTAYSAAQLAKTAARPATRSKYAQIAVEQAAAAIATMQDSDRRSREYISQLCEQDEARAAAKAKPAPARVTVCGANSNGGKELYTGSVIRTTKTQITVLSDAGNRATFRKSDGYEVGYASAEHRAAFAYHIKAADLDAIKMAETEAAATPEQRADVQRIRDREAADLDAITPAERREQLAQAIETAKKVRYPYAVGAQEIKPGRFQITATPHRAFMMTPGDQFGIFGNGCTPEQDQATEAAIIEKYEQWEASHSTEPTPDPEPTAAEVAQMDEARELAALDAMRHRDDGPAIIATLQSLAKIRANARGLVAYWYPGELENGPEFAEYVAHSPGAGQIDSDGEFTSRDAAGIRSQAAQYMRAAQMDDRAADAASNAGKTDNAAKFASEATAKRAIGEALKLIAARREAGASYTAARQELRDAERAGADEATINRLYQAQHDAYQIFQEAARATTSNPAPVDTTPEPQPESQSDREAREQVEYVRAARSAQAAQILKCRAVWREHFAPLPEGERGALTLAKFVLIGAQQYEFNGRHLPRLTAQSFRNRARQLEETARAARRAITQSMSCGTSDMYDAKAHDAEQAATIYRRAARLLPSIKESQPASR